MDPVKMRGTAGSSAAESKPIVGPGSVPLRISVTVRWWSQGEREKKERERGRERERDVSMQKELRQK